MDKNKRNWQPFVLLLVDIQQDFWGESMTQPLASFGSSVSQLLAFCRAEGLEVVHLRAGFQADKSDWMMKYKLGDWTPCVEGTAGVEPLPFAAECPGEQIFVKQTFDGFQNPALFPYLTANKKRFVLVAGLLTSVCVFLTAASAAQQGFLTAVVEDCCADRSPMHDHVLENYRFIFERVQSKSVAQKWAGWQNALDQLENV